MAETIFQKRIYELETYEPVNPGEPGYDDPATLYLGIDKLNWPEARKIPLVEFIATLHKEQGPIPLNGVVVEETFETPMASTNYYLNINCFRQYDLPGVGNVIENIPFKNLVKTTLGFSLQLESYQVNDTFNYLAFE